MSSILSDIFTCSIKIFFSMTDAEKMTKLLLELKLDAEGLGKTIGRHGGDSIRNVLKGRNNISAKLAKSISDNHGVSYVWLMTGDGPIFDESRDSSGSPVFKPGYSAADDKDFIIKQLQDIIAAQKELIKSLLAQIEKLQNIGN